MRDPVLEQDQHRQAGQLGPGLDGHPEPLLGECRRQPDVHHGDVWTASTTTAGYLAARSLPGLTHYLMPLIAVFTAGSLAAAAVSAVRARRRRQAMPYGREVRRPPHLAGSAHHREVL